MLKATLITVGVLFAIVAIVTAIGFALPQGHTATRDATFAQPPDRVFAVLQDIERYPAWRSDLEAVEMLTRGPAPRWRERGRNGTITFEMQEAQAPSRMVTRIADTSLEFGGSWTYALSADGAGTRLTLTENGEVYNPIFRFMSRFVFGHTATMDAVLSDLGRHLR
jgi:uncharacterized protein YndB with AHSA1/START domain